MSDKQIISISNQIFIIPNFWDKQQCDDYISRSEDIGYKAAAINTGMGRQRVVESVRNNKRVMYKDFELAENIWNDLSSLAPQKIGNSIAIGLNEMFRFYRYKPGEEFKKHRDQSFVRNNEEASYYTFMIYLNDNFEGGETTFNDRIVRPVTGMALIFLHDLEHSGSPVKRGVKYVLRTDIMYSLEEK